MQIQTPQRGPIARVMAIIGGIAVLALAATLGIVVLAVLLGLALIGAVIIAVRTWWLRHQMRRHGHRDKGAYRNSGITIIEGEYTKESRREPPDSR
ncbi:hypothetical protein LRD18_06895 [Halorhodospira halochloris]|uniref:hypothetical protein n=1 Tax=Halorhodospira halochloris TaxID=1052 RepID=UPI001EE97BFF|nr:hypothetical protein [Halorhodospira halochloris]MCG5530599.1 hypothetical protein [Halorhodospira halochloris]